MSKGRLFGYIAFGLFTFSRAIADSNPELGQHLISAMIFFIVLAVVSAFKGDFNLVKSSNYLYLIEIKA